ncbi:PilW family protein [Methylomonas sp. TEB]|uniref:PilW family protein n=2 Tax=unclassified Methylomonas TaxID=2608980 RepID=UPI0039F4E520|nr:pilus assembly protein PilW [Methylomonas sp. ZR1]
MRKNQTYFLQTGMTLIEIMIALLLGAFLLGGVIKIFVNAKQTYGMQEGLSRLQENSRYALEILSKDLRLSGFQGCISITDLTPTNTATTAITSPVVAPAISSPTPATIIVGYNGSEASPVTTTWSPALPSALSGLATPITPGTDVITVVFGESCGGYLSADMASASSDIQISSSNTCGIVDGDPVLISSCSNADLFRATTGTTSTLIKHNTVSLPATCASPPCYKTSSEVFAYRAYSYFIRPGASGEPALWRYDNTKAASSSNPVEILDGIENLQILYGEDTDADGVANQYKTAANVTDITHVASVRISILARTSENLASQTLTYDYNGSTGINPGDRRIRRVFNATLAVRNRLQ